MGPVDEATHTLDRNYSNYRRGMLIPTTDGVRNEVFKTLTNNLVLGNETVFDVARIGTFLEKCELQITISALTTVGAGTYARLCDYAGPALIKEIVFASNETNFERHSGKKTVMEIFRSADTNTFFERVAPLGGELSPAQRNTLALGSQTFKVDLAGYWNNQRSKDIVLSALSRDLRLIVTFANASDVVQTDYTSASFTITKAVLSTDVGHVTGIERDIASKEAYTDDGIQVAYEDYKIQQSTIPAGNSEYVVELNGFVLPFTSTITHLQLASDVNVPFQKKYLELDPTLLNNIDRIEFRESDGLAIDTIYGPDYVRKRWEENFPNVPFRKPLILCRAGTDARPLSYKISGTLNPQNFKYYSIYFKFLVPTPADIVVSHYAFQVNVITQQGGELTRIFN